MPSLMFHAGLRTAHLGLRPCHTACWTYEAHQHLFKAHHAHYSKSAHWQRERWSPSEIERLATCVKEAQTRQEMLPQFPQRSINSISLKALRLGWASGDVQKRKAIAWSAEDNTKLESAMARNAQPAELKALFPTRTLKSIRMRQKHVEESRRPNIIKGKITTAELEQLHTLRDEQGLPWAEIGRILNRTSVSVKAAYRGVRPKDLAKFRSKPPYTNLDTSEVLRLHDLRTSSSRIATLLGVSRHAVVYRLEILRVREIDRLRAKAASPASQWTKP